MVEWIVSSCVLIVIVALLRFLLKGKISLRLQYVLWALVLVRLLVPVSFGQSGFSVMNAFTVKQTEYYVWYTGDMGNVQAEPEAGEQAISPAANAVSPGIRVGPNTNEIPANTAGIQLDRILLSIWVAGIAAAAVLLLFSNLRFAVHLRRSRQRVECEQAVLPVFESGAVETPCLFGLFRPAIYVTPEVLTDETALRHVLAHETTHYRHGDHIWALLRCVCLALHWYNPLVWWAASLSRRDGELACDEGTIKRIGEEERVEYGRTLINLTCAKRGALLTTATTMTGSKRSIKERITLIAKKPKTLVLALVIAVAVCLAAVGCTFTAAEEAGPWTWAKGLSSEDVEEVKIWIDHQYGATYKDYSLAKDEVDSLVARINKLSKSDFKQNSELVGTMPEYGLILTCGEEWYSISQYNDSNGTLEMRYDGNMWWIKDKKLYDVVSSLLAAYSADKSGRTVLNEEEIAQVNEAFTPIMDNEEGRMMVNPLSCFFTSYFDQPESLDLIEFLRYFPSDEIVNDGAEFEALKAHESWTFGADTTLDQMPIPIHKFSAAAINEVLEQNAGISVSDLTGWEESSELLYLEEYDAYYNFTSDFGAGSFSCVRGEREGENIILYSNHSVLTLHKSGENYLIRSYMPMQSSPYSILQTS